MLVIPGTSEIHAQSFARALDSQVSGSPLDSQETAFFFVGVHPGLKPTVEALRARGAKCFAYWIGSDSMSAVRNAAYRRDIPEFDLHFAVHENIQKELKAWKVASHVVYPCPKEVPEPLNQWPREPLVAVYMPHTGSLYMFEETLTVVEETPELSYVFYGAMEDYKLPENAKNLGRLEPDEVGKELRNTTCLLRLCDHDGFPVSGIEWKMQAKNVLENIEYPGFLYVKSIEEATARLRDPMTHERDTGPYPAWYREECAPSAFARKVISKIRSVAAV